MIAAALSPGKRPAKSTVERPTKGSHRLSSFKCMPTEVHASGTEWALALAADPDYARRP